MAAVLHLIVAFICRRVTPGLRATRFSIFSWTVRTHYYTLLFDYNLAPHGVRCRDIHIFSNYYKTTRYCYKLSTLVFMTPAASIEPKQQGPEFVFPAEHPLNGFERGVGAQKAQSPAL